MSCITSQKTSSPAPPHCPDSSARKRAASSMMPPRAQFTTRTPFLHLANTASLIRSATSKSSILATTLSSLCDNKILTTSHATNSYLDLKKTYLFYMQLHKKVLSWQNIQTEPSHALSILHLRCTGNFPSPCSPSHFFLKVSVMSRCGCIQH